MYITYSTNQTNCYSHCRRVASRNENRVNRGQSQIASKIGENLLHFRAHKCSIKHTRKTTMVRDVDNHGHKIWSPFSSGGIHSPIDGNASKNTFNDAQKMEFVLHANIIHSVRVYVLSVVYARRISLPLSLMCVCVLISDDFFCSSFYETGILPKRFSADGRYRRFDR